MNAQTWLRHWERGLDWETYLATDPAKAEAWRGVHARAALDDDQRALVAGFTREVKVIVLTGIWCGDCAQQGPLLRRIEEGNPERVRIRWVDRDAEPELSERLTINAGARVPVVAILAEDGEPVAIRGDRTLARYRALAAKALGSACPLPGAELPEDELRATLADWLDEIERAHLLLRLSGRLRQKHGD